MNHPEFNVGQERSDSVDGERAASSVTRMLSVQSRIGNFLALGLICVLGLGSLTWYYASAMTRQGRNRDAAKAAAANRAQGDMPLPSLGRIVAPREALPFNPATSALAADPASLSANSLPEIPLASAPPPLNNTGTAAAKSPAQLDLERKLAGAVFVPRGSVTPSGLAVAASPGEGSSFATESTSGASPESSREAGYGSAPLKTLLNPTVTAAVRARVLPAQRLLLPKGAFIDCTLETAIDSTLPGMTTCVMATDAFGVDGRVVLLERGTKLIGETRGQVQQGAARLFVLWTEARTPAGVVVPLDSPGTDELGRSGLSGQINRHFWQRFGAAMLISVVDGAVQSAVQASRGSGGTVVLNPGSSENVLTEILKSTLSVAPTITKHNGDRIQVLVARDVDFRSVYELRAVASDR